MATNGDAIAYCISGVTGVCVRVCACVCVRMCVHVCAVIICNRTLRRQCNRKAIYMKFGPQLKRTDGHWQRATYESVIYFRLGELAAIELLLFIVIKPECT